MSAQTVLSGGDKWYSYSGVVSGDVSVPASIQLVFLPNTGLRDSLVSIQPYYGRENNDSGGNVLGIEVKIDDVTVIKQQSSVTGVYSMRNTTDFNLFVPRQSKFEVISLNTSGNNVQERGCTVLGYYL
tara:strand:- start:356 stop:739 length:384 start_codon:yes stop_codon:yes gene_type:complete